MSPKEKTVIRAIVKALHVKRDRLGRLDHDNYLHCRDMDALTTSYPIPHGGRDQVDKACMLLQALIGDTPTSVVDLK